MSNDEWKPPVGVCNRLSAAETEMLALIAEEAGEIVQAVGKILRHGFDSRHPRDLNGPDNRERLVRELGDLKAAIVIADQNNIIDAFHVQTAVQDKLARIGQYLHAVRWPK